jgi:hypothetical protein
MASNDTANRPRVGQRVVDESGRPLGEVCAVWADVGISESWGAAGSRLMEGVEANDPAEFAWSEAMPGEGESYFCLRCADGSDLYVPFSYIADVRGDAVVLSVAADDVPAMRWDLRPDFLHENKPRPGPSEGANPPQPTNRAD